jgi:hypothetical protein
MKPKKKKTLLLIIYICLSLNLNCRKNRYNIYFDKYGPASFLFSGISIKNFDPFSEESLLNKNLIFEETKLVEDLTITEHKISNQLITSDLINNSDKFLGKIGLKVNIPYFKIGLEGKAVEFLQTISNSKNKIKLNYKKQ